MDNYFIYFVSSIVLKKLLSVVKVLPPAAPLHHLALSSCQLASTDKSDMHPPLWLPSIQICIGRLVGCKCRTTSSYLR